MKEVYVYRLPNDSLADIGKKIDSAAVEAGVILSAKKRKVLLTACVRNGEVLVKGAELKAHKELDRVTISVFTDTRTLLNSTKVEKKYFSLDEVISDFKPVREPNFNEFWMAQEKIDKGSYNLVPQEIGLPKGSIEKLIGKQLTWEDEPVELKEVK